MPNELSLSVAITKQEAETLYKASRGKLSCPRCGRPLKAGIRLFFHTLAETPLQGVKISCSLLDEEGNEVGCGFNEW